MELGVLSFSEHRAPTFTIEPPNKVIFLNSSGESVHCAALGNPRPSISWVLADGTAVTDLPGLRLSLANGTLLFLPFMAESYRQDIHASTYRCIASNLVGKISSRDIRVRAAYQLHNATGKRLATANEAATPNFLCHPPASSENYGQLLTRNRSAGD
ncbi:down syndrome cell adhesion molecule-like protein Dscam2 [Caerostris darwini]|uniref:Down syndrome cell adhesion molecule-like protein Dscam2 n=1 Tax=Caerostris darwini TaxID=1538125 RepID=A0AAV4MXJ3_9ARAC|nr:down syndrome cell adhesion molecule-like protein Dscam2 [Caerostris darwini]